MQTQAQFDTYKQVLIIEQGIKSDQIKTVKQLLARTGKANLPYSVYIKLYHKMVAKQNSKIPMFLRKQAF